MPSAHLRVTFVLVMFSIGNKEAVRHQGRSMSGMKRSLMAASDGQGSATVLSELEAQDIDVFCWCNRCSHNAQIATERLVAELGPDFPVPEVGARLRCSGCGSKDIATRPAWPSPGTVARHS